MTLLEIEAFLKIAQCGNFSSAAEKLYITQPALGRRIRALEDELGYSLFVRSKGVRRVELTRQGRAFVPIAHRWQLLWNETREDALLGSEKNFYISSLGSLLAFTMPSIFHDFMLIQPTCSLHVTTLHSDDAYNHVINKEVDIAFVSDPLYSAHVKTEILFKEKMCLVAGNQLNLPQDVNISDLDPRQEIYVMWDRNFASWHDYYFGSSVLPRVHIDDMGFLRYFAQNGDNWTFMPVSVVKSIMENIPISIHALDVKIPSRTIYYLYREGDVSQYQTELLEICRRQLSNREGIKLMEPILSE